MHMGDWENMSKWHDEKLSASVVSGWISQLLRCIHILIDAQLKHGSFLLEYCSFFIAFPASIRPTYLRVKSNTVLKLSHIRKE